MASLASLEGSPVTPRERKRVNAALRRIMLRNRGPLQRAERRYVLGLRAVFRGIHEVYNDYLTRAIEETAAKGDATNGPGRKPSGKIKTDVERLEKAITPQIGPKVRPIFNVMANEVAKANAKIAKEIWLVTPKAIGVEKILADAQERNVRLVEDANRAYSKQVRDVFTDPENFGRSVDALKRELFDRGGVSDSRAELIARDQTLKTNAEINGARQESAGIERYIWSTSLDERVRGNPAGRWPDAEISHYDLEGKIFSWDDPPEPGHPGEDYQCRCVALPYIEALADIAFDY